MLTVEKEKKYTVADYMLLEEGVPFQLINYDLIISPSPSPLHQIISIRLSQIILNYLDSTNNNGVVLAASMDVKFDEGNVLQPDEKYGVKEYILIDPVQENADVYALEDSRYQLPQKVQKNETLNSILLQGLSTELSKLFN